MLKFLKERNCMECLSLEIDAVHTLYSDLLSQRRIIQYAGCLVAGGVRSKWLLKAIVLGHYCPLVRRGNAR